MNIKNVKKVLTLALLAITITSCGGTGPSNFALATTQNYSNRALDESMDMTALTSVGTQKILVVPVVFTNSANATPQMHETITTAFFGEASDTGWESVASFYHKSSYGKLTLTGEVMPYFNTGMSTFELTKKEVSKTQEIGEGNYWDPTHYVIEQIYNTYSAAKLREYDTDGDGHVDALWMVYLAPIHAHDSDVFWAYKFYWNRLANTAKPTPNTYAWAGVDFMQQAQGYSFAKPDAHTFIHETGHVLGLPDYYDYDRHPSSGMPKTNPTGGLDMMANNVIDHNMYSKYRFNWATPFVVTGDADITLKPAESSGEFVLIKDGWNGHAYDEYLLVEFYTPTGINEQDSSGNGYGESNNSAVKGYSVNGVRIWHVDSRLQFLDFKSGNPVASWTNEFKSTADGFTTVAASNTASRSANPEFKLLHLLNAKGTSGNAGNWLKTGATAGNSALFQTGDKIEATNWKKYFQYKETFNDGTNVGYSIEIGKMTDEGVKVIIRKA